MTDDREFERLMRAFYGYGIAFARGRLGLSLDRAQDVVQQGMLNAWAARTRFDGSNFNAWALTIIRNVHLSEMRRPRLFITLNDPDHPVPQPTCMGSQESAVELRGVLRQITKLPLEQVDSLMRRARGHDYDDESAAALGCAIGTMKSRVSRARKALVE